MDFSSPIALLRPSATSRKSKGDRGNPCLSPYYANKKEKVVPLMRVANHIVDIQLMIQFIKGSSNPG